MAKHEVAVADQPGSRRRMGPSHYGGHRRPERQGAVHAPARNLTHSRPAISLRCSRPVSGSGRAMALVARRGLTP